MKLQQKLEKQNIRVFFLVARDCALQNIFIISTEKNMFKTCFISFDCEAHWQTDKSRIQR